MRYFLPLILGLLVSCGSSKKHKTDSKPEAVEVVLEAPGTSQAPRPTPEPNSVWSLYSVDDLPDLERRLEPSSFVLWKCNYDRFMTDLIGDDIRVLLPVEGDLQTFTLQNSGTMSKALAEKFPNIKSYKGESENGTTARVDTNDEGFFAEYKNGSTIWLVAPYLKGSKSYYIFYEKSSLPSQSREDSFEK
jgi:hypothetical protein